MSQKMKQLGDSIIQKKIGSIMVEKVYLWMMLFLKFTFDILLSHKINFQQNWIKNYECLPKHYTWKMSFDHYSMIVYIIWTIEIK